MHCNDHLLPPSCKKSSPQFVEIFDIARRRRPPFNDDEYYVCFFRDTESWYKSKKYKVNIFEKILVCDTDCVVDIFQNNLVNTFDISEENLVNIFDIFSWYIFSKNLVNISYMFEENLVELSFNSTTDSKIQQLKAVKRVEF